MYNNTINLRAPSCVSDILGKLNLKLHCPGQKSEFKPTWKLRVNIMKSVLKCDSMAGCVTLLNSDINSVAQKTEVMSVKYRWL
jgi:hypothetical protein